MDQNSPDILLDLNSGENWLMNVNMSKKVRYVGYIKSHISLDRSVKERVVPELRVMGDQCLRV